MIGMYITMFGLLMSISPGNLKNPILGPNKSNTPKIIRNRPIALI